MPVLTPLLAQLVARRGLPVLMHGTDTESSRVFVPHVLAAMDIEPLTRARVCGGNGRIRFASLRVV